MFKRNTSRQTEIQKELHPSSSLRMAYRTTTEWMNNFSRLLITSSSEKSEIEKEGHSFTTLVKDLYRIIHRDFIQNGFSIEEIKSIFDLWENPPFYIATKLKLSEAKAYHLNQIYFGAKDYLSRQLETLIGETLIATDPSKLSNSALSEFIKRHKFKQRIFNYSLNANQLYQMILGAYSSYRVKSNERELIELINLIKIFLSHKKIDEEFKTKLIDELSKIGIDIYQYIEFPIQSEDFVVEVSPPYEDYSFQKHVMLRIYDSRNEETRVTQCVVPYENSEELLSYVEELNGKNQRTAQSNRILSSLIFARTNDLKSHTISNVLQILMGNNEAVLEENDKLFEPIKKDVQKHLDPFVSKFFSQLGIIHHQEFFINAVNNLNDFVFHLTSKHDSRFAAKDKKLEKEIREGKFLSAFANPISSPAPTPQLQGSYSGGCNSISPSKKDSGPKSGISEGKTSTQTVTGKNGEVLQFKTVKKADGSEEKYILCPVCRSGYFDVCALDKICDKCGNSGTSVYNSYESGSLSLLRNNYESRSSTHTPSQKVQAPAKVASPSSEPSVVGNFSRDCVDIFENFLNSVFGFAKSA